MSALSIVRTKLAATAAVTALVSNRIYPIIFPQEAVLPCIVLNIISGADIAAHLAGQGGYYRHRIRTEMLDDDASDLDSLSDAVLAALNGVIKATIANCVDVDILFGGLDMTDYSDDRTTFRRLLDFDVTWRAA